MAQNHLLRRRTRYYFRRRFSDELREIIGRKEIKKALGTSEQREAAKLARIEALKIDELFESKRREVQQVAPQDTRMRIGYSESVLLVARWYRQLEEQCDEWLETNLDIFQNSAAELAALRFLVQTKRNDCFAGVVNRCRRGCPDFVRNL